MFKRLPSPKPPRLAGPQEAVYEVGYGKPPVVTQFKSGISGNPRGRPKGAKNKLPALNEERLKTIVMEEAYRTIKVREGERNITIPIAKAVVRTIAVAAVRGNNRAAQLFTLLVQTVERDNKELYTSYMGSALDYKDAWDKELERRRQFGITGPEPVPHPDDIVFNSRSGAVTIKGPMTKAEKELWDVAEQIKVDCGVVIERLERRLKRKPDAPDREVVLSQIEEQRRLRQTVCKFVPDREPFDRLF